MAKIKEFAFDVKLAAVVRVRAESEAAARDAMEAVMDAVDISHHFIDGFNSAAESVTITEASLTQDSPRLFEIDREDV